MDKAMTRIFLIAILVCAWLTVVTIIVSLFLGVPFFVVPAIATGFCALCLATTEMVRR